MLLSNPLVSPFLPTLETVFVSLFGGSLLAMLIAARNRSVLLARWRTWLIIAPLFSVAVLSGPLAVALFAAAIALQGGREYANLLGLPPADRAVLFGAAICSPLISIALPADHLVLVLTVIPLAATMPALIEQDVENGIRRVTSLAFGLWYLPISLSLMVRLSPGVLLAIALGVALSDIGAYTFGKLFGQRWLAATLSPSKTWAGVAGNLAGAALGLWLLHPLGPDTPLVILAPTIAIGAVWGDLLESLLKRGAGTKDAGHWLPGFGGLLDRADSLLVVLPLAYVALRLSA